MKFTTALALFAVGCTAHATPAPSQDHAMKVLMFCTAASEYVEEVAERRDQGITLAEEEATIDKAAADPESAATLKRLAANPYKNRRIPPTTLAAEAFKYCMQQN